MRCRAFAAISLLVAAAAAPVRAEPQGNIGATLGAAGKSTDGFWSDTRLHLGVHGDVLFGRKRNADFGLGPFVEALTAFDDFQTGGGLSALLPVHPYLPLVLSGGGYARRADSRWEPGASLQLFWGSRSFNHRSWYVMAGGLRLQLRQGFGESAERSVVVAAHIDGEVLILPVLLAYAWVRGPTE